MTTEIELPIWLRPVTLDGWPTEIVEDAALRYALPIRRGWSTRPLVKAGPTTVDHAFCGVYPAEWCIISFMEAADPAQDIRVWIDAVVQMTGFPVPLLAEPYKQPPRLLAWAYQGQYPAFAAKTGLDEFHAYQGLAQLPENPPELARIYMLLARRGSSAWKVTLSFESACLPGTAEAQIASNDHVRAGATFGFLSFSAAQAQMTT